MFLFKKPLLYIFVHIPKTSGEAIKRNIEQSIPKSAMMRASFEYSEYYFDVVKQQGAFFQGHEQFHHYIQSLSSKQKKRIRFLAGHNAYFGLHHHFPQPAKYITFIREPLARTLSLYNFETMAWALYAQKSSPLNPLEHGFLERLKNHFLINNQPPSFEAWLNQSYDQSIPFYHSMTNYLDALGFSHEAFDFIGLTEQHEQDALYLYNALGIKCKNADKNKSPQYVTLESLPPDVMATLIEKNAQDIAFYQKITRSRHAATN